MSRPKRTILLSLALLAALIAGACGAHAPAASPTPQNTPLPSSTPTIEATPLPSDTPPPEIQQLPGLPPADLEGSVDVGGHKLSYKCYGQGSPTVIVEAGAEDRPTNSMSWNAVVQGVSSTTRICIYDRAFVHTSQEAAENLHGLLAGIPQPGPYVLVAHSIGGWYARVFAHLYPDEVSGMILVDTTSTFPESTVIAATAYPTYSPDESAGVTQNRYPEAGLLTFVPPSVDGLDMKASNEQVRQAGSFGNLPLIVITHTPGPGDLMGIEPALQPQMAAIIIKVQASLVGLSSQGVLITASTHQHFISEYEPQTVIDAILRMVAGIRK